MKPPERVSGASPGVSSVYAAPSPRMTSQSTSGKWVSAWQDPQSLPVRRKVSTMAIACPRCPWAIIPIRRYRACSLGAAERLVAILGHGPSGSSGQQNGRVPIGHHRRGNPWSASTSALWSFARQSKRGLAAAGTRTPHPHPARGPLRQRERAARYRVPSQRFVERCVSFVLLRDHRRHRIQGASRSLEGGARRPSQALHHSGWRASRGQLTQPAAVIGTCTAYL